MTSEEPVVFEAIVLDLAVASHVDHPALANPFPVSIREWIRRKGDGWLVGFQRVEFRVRNLIGVWECEGGRIPGQEGEMRIIGYRKYGYPGRNEAGSESGINMTYVAKGEQEASGGTQEEKTHPRWFS